METRLRMLIVLAGLPEPEVNIEVLDAVGRVLYRLDLSYPDLEVLVEYVGRQHRADLDQWDHDLDRRDWLDAHGWLQVQVVSRGIYRDPDKTVRRVEDALRSRGAALPRRLCDAWRPHFPGRDRGNLARAWLPRRVPTQLAATPHLRSCCVLAGGVRTGRADRVARLAGMTDPLDFLAVDGLLDQDERDVRDTVRSFAQAELAPHVAQWYDAGTLPDDLGPTLGKLGLLGMHLDGYGCAGTSATAYGVACRELEAVDSGLRSFVSVQGSLAMYALHRWGTDQHKEEWLPRMASGEAIGCFGLTEAEAGSDPGSLRTRAVRDGEDWVLDGSKMWITNGTLAEVAVIWARVDDGGPEDGIRGFVVPTSTPGFTATKILRKLSLRASVTAELSLDGVRLPGDAVFPEVRGLKGPLSCLNEARFGILWGAVGAARACYAEALAYSLERSQFGRPLAAFQLTQRKLADMVVAVNNASLAAVHLGRLKDAAELSPAQVSYGKLANVRAALEVARSARTVLGGAGITLDHTVMRHMNNLETVMTYEGTEEMHALSLGAAITGLPAFR
jgi:glutaryl-CoA dehydrogenase